MIASSEESTIALSRSNWSWAGLIISLYIVAWAAKGDTHSF